MELLLSHYWYLSLSSVSSSDSVELIAFKFYLPTPLTLPQPILGWKGLGAIGCGLQRIFGFEGCRFVGRCLSIRLYFQDDNSGGLINFVQKLHQDFIKH